MINYFENGVHFSLSTIPIPYGVNKLAVIHMKVEYKKLKNHESVRIFLENQFTDQIYRHGKFLYFMMFVELNSNFQVNRISMPFIPTTSHHSHLPYLLVFPMSLTKLNATGTTQYFLNYGEGDSRCKILQLAHEEIENLLYYTNQIKLSELEFMMLNIDEFQRKPKIYHFGYFFEKNCGDDLFMIIFQHLDHSFRKKYNICFRNFLKPDEINQEDIVIYGGGDIINPYFCKTFPSKFKRLLAIGVGTPFTSYINLLDHFDFVYTRNRIDSNKDKNILYSPDIVFLLHKFLCPIYFDSPPLPLFNQKMKVGISICRTYHDPLLQNQYIDFIESFAKSISNFDSQCAFYFIPFCIPQKNRENDNLIHQHIMECLMTEDICDTMEYIRESDYIRKIVNFIQQMDVMICARFHAHILSIMYKKPFVSITCSRKCELLLQEFNLTDLLFPIEFINYIPAKMDIELFKSFFSNFLTKRHEIHQRLETIMEEVDQQTNEFVNHYHLLLSSDA
jgi:hypothetical protein